MILSLSGAGPSALWTGVEIFIVQARQQEQSFRARGQARARGSGAWWTAVAGFLSGFVPSPTAIGAASKGKQTRYDEGGEDTPDPVLTAHDLFHSPNYDAALISHLRTLFPSVRTSRIERLVCRQGGSYASLRQRLEARVLELSGAGVDDNDDDEEDGDQRRRGRNQRRGTAGGAVANWWKRLIRLQAREDEVKEGVTTLHQAWPSRQRVDGRGRDLGTDDTAATPSSSSAGITASVRRTSHHFLAREIEAYDRACSATPDGSADRGVAPTGDEAEESAAESTQVAAEPSSNDEFECQCCFSTESSLPSNRFSCDGTPPVVDAVGNSRQSHVFCRACIRSFAETYAFGESRLSARSLERFALPCMAATRGEPCDGMIARTELHRALDGPLWAALDRRMTETVIERLADAGANAPSAPRVVSSAAVVRCPFCPYAELADPTPGPLVATFCPAWVREPFPPSLADLFRSVLGGVVLLPLLALVLMVLVLVTPARRLERVYERIAATKQEHHAATETASWESSRLTLSDRLLLEPRLLPTVVFAHLADLCEQVRARRHGRRTVFRCRNVADAVPGCGGHRRPRWEAVTRMDAVDTLDWAGSGPCKPESRREAPVQQEEEEHDPYVEERRRQRLVQFVWGEVADPHPSRSPEPPSPACGRLSCLLCLAALNPAAPSLHTCRPSTASPASASASPREQAEESLRLAVEKAMSAAVVRECARCGAGLTKRGGEGACNKVRSPLDFVVHFLSTC